MTDGAPTTQTASSGSTIELANRCRSLVSAWHEVCEQRKQPLNPMSPAANDARNFALAVPQAADPLWGSSAGHYAGLYVGAIAQHVLAFEALLRARRVTVAPWPIVRAQLELAGRVAWLLDPEITERSGERRVARLLLEMIGGLQRVRQTHSFRKSPKAVQNLAKQHRDAAIQEARAIFAHFNPGLHRTDEIEEWCLGEEKMMGLGAGCRLFQVRYLEGADGFYDYLSDFSHPSLLTIQHQTNEQKTSSGACFPWEVSEETLIEQVRWACAILYKAAHLIASYYSLDASPLELWADTVSTWFVAVARNV